MHNDIKSMGVKIPRDMELVQKLIDERLSDNGCKDKSFIFTAEKITTYKNLDGERVHFKKMTANGVKISVGLEGNQCVIGVLSSKRDENFMKPEAVFDFISPKPVKIIKDKTSDEDKTVPEKAKGAVQETFPQEVVLESEKETIPYSLQEVADETFIGVFYIFLKEFFEKRPSQVESSASICAGFNLSSACDSDRCLTTIRTARLLVELSRRGKVTIVQTKPHGLYSLATQENPVSETPVSTAPVQTSEPQTPKISDGNIIINLLTELLVQKKELEATLEKQCKAVNDTRESIQKVDDEIRGNPAIIALYETLRKTLG